MPNGAEYGKNLLATDILMESELVVIDQERKLGVTMDSSR